MVATLLTVALVVHQGVSGALREVGEARLALRRSGGCSDRLGCTPLSNIRPDHVQKLSGPYGGHRWSETQGSSPAHRSSSRRGPT
jgi:hypothetical protein